MGAGAISHWLPDQVLGPHSQLGQAGLSSWSVCRAVILGQAKLAGVRAGALGQSTLLGKPFRRGLLQLLRQHMAAPIRAATG